MIVNFTVTTNDRPIDLDMDIDETCIPDRVLIETFRASHVPEEELVGTLARVLVEGDFAIDGGANIGIFTLMMAKYVGLTGKVIAVEPGANNLLRLRRNVALNWFQNVQVIDRPLWKSNEELDFFLYEDSGHNSIGKFAETDIPTRLKAITLDEICGDQTPKLVKLDIEGAEVEALYGAREVLTRHPAFVVCEMNTQCLKNLGSTPEEMREVLRAYNYEPFMLYPNGHLPALVPIQSKLAPFRMNSNILFSTMDDIAKVWPEVAW